MNQFEERTLQLKKTIEELVSKEENSKLAMYYQAILELIKEQISIENTHSSAD